MSETLPMRQALAAMLPSALTAEQRARYAGVFAIVQSAAALVPHAVSEFAEPAPVFDGHVRARQTQPNGKPSVD